MPNKKFSLNVDGEYFEDDGTVVEKAADGTVMETTASAQQQRMALSYTQNSSAFRCLFDIACRKKNNKLEGTAFRNDEDLEGERLRSVT